MARYSVVLAKKHFVRMVIEANSEEEAKNKAIEGDYIEVLEDAFFLPDSDYEVKESYKEGQE